MIGTNGPTAPVSEGERLWRQAEDTATRLESPGFTVPVMTTSSLQVDPTRLASELRGLNDAFREALDAVALEERKAEASLEAKKAHIAEAVRIDAACALIYRGFFLLADRGDLAERFLRALRRRTRRRASSPGEVTPPGSGPPQDGEPPRPRTAGPPAAHRPVGPFLLKAGEVGSDGTPEVCRCSSPWPSEFY